MKLFYKLFKERILYKIIGAILWIALALLFIFVFSSCNPLSIDPLANYVIDKGAHNSYSYNYYNRKRERR